MERGELGVEMVGSRLRSGQRLQENEPQLGSDESSHGDREVSSGHRFSTVSCARGRRNLGFLRTNAPLLFAIRTEPLWMSHGRSVAMTWHKERSAACVWHASLLSSFDPCALSIRNKLYNAMQTMIAPHFSFC